MQTLIPQPVTAKAAPRGRLGRAVGFGLTPRALLLLATATLLSIPAFFRPGTPWLMFAVDALLLLACVADAVLLPAPERFAVTRRFLQAPEAGQSVVIELDVQQSGAAGVYRVRLADDLHLSMHNVAEPPAVACYPNDISVTRYETMPSQRGDLPLGKLYLRYRTALGLAERWAVAPLEQTVRVYAAGEPAGAAGNMYLLRARQIELEKRKLRQIGLGREFEAMRDYHPGDEMRNISWTSTARHNRLITRQYTTERSQQVWVVMDAGRLSRTAYGMGSYHGDEQDDAVAVVTQLDSAASAAGLLSRVVDGSGDKFALLTYGRRVQQQLLPGSGHLHLRRVLDALSRVRSESAEADHLMASSRLRQLQRRRSLVVWITEMTESAGQPEIMAAVSSLLRRHLVVLVLLQHPELNALAEAEPSTARGMYAGTAAQEMLEQRAAALAKLRAQGVLVVETTNSRLAPDAISQYLEIKAGGRL